MIRSVADQHDQHPLELILARNLLASISIAGFLTDEDGCIVFFNESCGELLGRRFEETGRLTREQWGEIGPLDSCGDPLPESSVPLGTALRENRPAHRRFRIRTDQQNLMEVEVSALPLIGPQGFSGAIVVFWPVEAGG